MTPTEATAEVTRFEVLLPLKLDVPDIHQQWRTLVEEYAVKGVNVHDARLVAVCILHGLTHILTFNDRDFRRYNEINVVHPDAVNSQS
jgi:predicted nucleic acid-binding protein